MSSLPYITAWLLNLLFSWLTGYKLHRGVSQLMTRRFWNTLGTWLPALALVGLCFLDKYGSTWPVVMLVLAVGLNAAIHCGFQINYVDLSPNFAGTMFAVSNFVASLISIGAPVLAGVIVTDEVRCSKSGRDLIEIFVLRFFYQFGLKKKYIFSFLMYFLIEILAINYLFLANFVTKINILLLFDSYVLI